MKLGSVRGVKVPVQVVLGGTDLSLDEISALGPGSIVGLTRLAGEPVQLVAAGQTIGLGEVVVINENFGIRITELVKKEA